METLQITWFWLVLALFAVYAALDGFDLGSGICYLFTRDEEKKRAILSSIAVFWDGNEVWLVAAGTCLFAAFPNVYATVFSSFYLAVIFLGIALMLRAVSIEFRNRSESGLWKKTFDAVFSFGSLAVSLLLGVAMGNILRGLHMGSSLVFAGTFFSLLNVYSLVVGLFSAAMFTFHGLIHLKQKKGLSLAAAAYVGLFAAVLALSYLWHPYLFANFFGHPALFALPLLSLMCVIYAASRISFAASAASIVINMAMAGAALYPDIIRTDSGERLMTLFNSSSSELTLFAMLIIALVGIPFVVGYTVWAYRTFRPL